MRSHGGKTRPFHREPLVPIDNRPAERPSTRSPAPYQASPSGHVSACIVRAERCQRIPSLAKGLCQGFPDISKRCQGFPGIAKGFQGNALCVSRHAYGRARWEAAPVAWRRFARERSGQTCFLQQNGVSLWLSGVWGHGLRAAAWAKRLLCPSGLVPFRALWAFPGVGRFRVLRCGREAIGGARMPCQALSSDCLRHGLRHCWGRGAIWWAIREEVRCRRGRLFPCCRRFGWDGAWFTTIYAGLRSAYIDPHGFMAVYTSDGHS